MIRRIFRYDDKAQALLKSNSHSRYVPKAEPWLHIAAAYDDKHEVYQVAVFVWDTREAVYIDYSWSDTSDAAKSAKAFCNADKKSGLTPAIDNHHKIDGVWTYDNVPAKDAPDDRRVRDAGTVILDINGYFGFKEGEYPKRPK